jgi:hypothetical protein
MNKLLISTVIACGLLLLDAPEAAAHDKRDRQHSSPRADYSDNYRRDDRDRRAYSRNRYRSQYYASKHKRAKRMPKWLHRDRNFQRWLERSHLRRDRWLSWNQLFEIYRWELSYNRHRHHRH